MYKKVLVPLDGSAVAEEALVYVRELAASGTEVTLLCVSAPEEGAYSPSHEAYIQKTAEAIRRQLAEVPQTAVSAQPASISNTPAKTKNTNPAHLVRLGTIALGSFRGRLAGRPHVCWLLYHRPPGKPRSLARRPGTC